MRPSIGLTVLLLSATLAACAEPVATGPKLDPERDAQPELELDASKPGELDARAPIDSATADRSIGKREVEAGPPTREHAVLRRTCPREPYGPDYLLTPTSTECGPSCRTGTECASSDDCTSNGQRGDCIGLVDGRCEYAGVPAQDRCVVDSDCTGGAAPRCRRDLDLTFCLYGTCRDDSDCKSNSHCVCSVGGGDPTCVVLGCALDTDCPASQECRVDSSYGGVASRLHCSTPQDSCTSNADCVARAADAGMDQDSYCGFDETTLRWLCRGFALID